MREVSPLKVMLGKSKLLFFGIVVLFFVALNAFTVGLLYFILNSDSRDTAREFIRNNPEIIAEIGPVEGFGMFGSANISLSGGHGDAQHNIRADGRDGTADVRVRLQRWPERGWEVVAFDFRVRS